MSGNKIDIYKAIHGKNTEELYRGLKQGVSPDLLDDYGQTPIFRIVFNAIDQQDEEMLKLLLENGASVNFRRESDGATVIHCAKSKRIAEILVEYGADVRIYTTYGSTPLHQVTSLEMADFFLSKGIDVNSKEDNGSTPLFDAVYFGFDLVEFLLRKGASAEIKNRIGWTPLICLARTEYATPVDNIEIKILCDELIKYGAQVDTIDNDGKNAYAHALEVNNEELAEYLKNKKTKTQHCI